MGACVFTRGKRGCVWVGVGPACAVVDSPASPPTPHPHTRGPQTATHAHRASRGMRAWRRAMPGCKAPEATAAGSGSSGSLALATRNTHTQPWCQAAPACRTRALAVARAQPGLPLPQASGRTQASKAPPTPTPPVFKPLPDPARPTHTGVPPRLPPPGLPCQHVCGCVRVTSHLEQRLLGNMRPTVVMRALQWLHVQKRLSTVVLRSAWPLQGTWWGGGRAREDEGGGCRTGRPYGCCYCNQAAVMLTFPQPTHTQAHAQSHAVCAAARPLISGFRPPPSTAVSASPHAPRL